MFKDGSIFQGNVDIPFFLLESLSLLANCGLSFLGNGFCFYFHIIKRTVTLHLYILTSVVICLVTISKWHPISGGSRIPRRSRQPSRRGVPAYKFARFSEKLRKFWSVGGCALGAFPLDSPLPMSHGLLWL